MAEESRQLLAEAIKEFTAALVKAMAAPGSDRGQGIITAALAARHQASGRLLSLPIDSEKDALRIINPYDLDSVEILPLSGSTDGRGIKVAATATPGTTIHTAASGRSSLDLVHLFAVNSDTTARKLTIEHGGTTSPDDLVEFTVPAEDGLYPILPGLPLRNGLILKAFCASANLVLLHGWVERRAR